MLRIVLDKELQHLTDEIFRMGSEVEENLYQTVDALERRDSHLAQQLIEADRWVNALRIQIGVDALTLIATQQPMASDMRRIATIIEIAGELERIHDYVKGIAKINLMIDGRTNVRPLISHLPQMVSITQEMLRQALDALARRDIALAVAIPERDAEVDALYRDNYKLIIDFITHNPASFEYAHRLEWATHNIERAADRIINICEWIAYMISGEFEELDDQQKGNLAHLKKKAK